MPLVELEDKELARLRALERDHADAANWRKSWGDLLADPELKLDAWRLFKKKYPNVPVPELDTVEAASKPILAELEALKKQIADDKEAATKEKTEAEEAAKKARVTESMDASHRRLKADGWDDDGIKAIEKLMLERGVGDYEIAAKYLKSQMPSPAPLNSTYEGRDLNWFNPGEDEPDSKLLMENPKKYKSDMIRKFFQDKANGDLRGWAA